MNIGKKYKSKSALIDKKRIYSINDGIAMIKDTSITKFDSTVDVAIRLKVNPRKADQLVKGSVELPYGTGRSVAIIAFVDGEYLVRAENAGCDLVGGDELIAKILNGTIKKLPYQYAITTPEMIGKVSKIAKILGPRGLMPNVKVGTITNNIENVVKSIKKGKVHFSVDKYGIIHLAIGKVSFAAESLITNYNTLVDEVYRLQPHTVKGNYVISIYISTTMGPSIRLV